MESVLEAVADYMNDIKAGEVLVNPLPGVCPLAIRTKGVMAYFRVTKSDRLHGDWQTAQTRIAGESLDSYPLRLYLTLLVSDAEHPAPAWEPIWRDLQVCRKVLVPTRGQRVEEWAEDLPFLPLPDEAVSPRVVETPGDALFTAGFRANLAGALLDRTAATSVARQFGERRVLAPPGDPRPKEVLLTSRARHRRLLQVEVDNFRPFAGTLLLPREGQLGDLTVVYGPNGSGKSSLTQAIEWGIIGEVASLEESHADVKVTGRKSPYINIYHPDRPACVRLTLLDERTGQQHTFEREVRPSGTVLWQGEVLRTPGRALTKVTGADLPTVPHVRILRTMARQSHFLDQETIRDFLSSSAGDRYQALANMIGTVDFGRALKKLGQVRSIVEDDLAAANNRKAEAASLLQAEQGVHRELQERFRQLHYKPAGTTDLLGTASELRQSAHEFGLALPDLPDTEALPGFAESLRTLLSALRSQLTTRLQTLSDLRDNEKNARQSEISISHLTEEIAVVSRDLQQNEEALARHAEVLQATRAQVEQATAEYQDADRQTREKWERLESMRALHATAGELDSARVALARAEAELLAAVAVEQAAAERAGVVAAEWQDLSAQRDAWQDQNDALDEMQAFLPRLQSALAARARIHSRRGEVTVERDNLRSTHEQLTQDFAEAEKLRREKSHTLNRLQATLSERHRLLGALIQHLDDSRCPLCRQEWDSVDHLRHQVQAALQETPPELLAAQQNLAMATTRCGDLQAELEHVAAELQTREKELGALQQELDEVRSVVRQWLDLVRRAGLPSDAVLENPARVLTSIRAQLRAADPTHRIAEVESAMQASQQAAHRAQTQREVAEKGMNAASATLARAEEAYRQADRAAPPEVGRPWPALEQMEAAHRECSEWEERLTETVAALQTAKDRRAKAETAFRAARAALQAVRDRKERLAEDLTRHQSTVRAHTEQLVALGLAAGGLVLAEELSQVRAQLAHVEKLREKAAWLTGAIEGRALATAVQNAEARVRLAQRDMLLAQDEVNRHAETLDLIAKAADALDQARAREQDARFMYYEPTINEIYRRINPHPFFPHLRWQPSSQSSELTMYATTREGRRRLPVQRYFSMAQANVVALSVFLGSALLQNWSGLRLISIDDPIQQMDDVNTVAFLDVLHAVIERKRQVVLTTANKEFYRMLLKRYAYLNGDHPSRFRAFRLRTVNLIGGPEVVEDTPIFLPSGAVRLGGAG